MQELQLLDRGISMTSKELSDLINVFRKEERGDSAKELKHKDFMKKIRTELDTLESLCLGDGRNISLVEYTDNKGEKRPCYELNRDWIFRMGMSESVYVRTKIIEYINALENRLTKQNTQITLPNLDALNIQLQEVQQAISIQQEQLREQREHIEYLNDKIGIRAKEKYNYGAVIKRHLCIDRVNGDYKTIRDMFFHELGVTKWEDIPYSRENVALLDEICKAYRPKKRVGLMAQVFGE